MSKTENSIHDRGYSDILFMRTHSSNATVAVRGRVIGKAEFNGRKWK